MISIYNTFLDFPIFQGVSHDQLSCLLEKTRLEFLNYKSGDIIISHGENINRVSIVLSGNVKIVHYLFDGGLIIEEISGKNTVIGVERLFGLINSIPYDVISEEGTSIVNVNKEQYINIITSHRIYLYNLLNYLSARAQILTDKLVGCSMPEFNTLLKIIRGGVCLSHPKFIFMEMTESFLNKIMSMNPNSDFLIKFADKRKIKIKLTDESGAL